MTDDRVHDALEQALPLGWALDGAKPIVGSHWRSNWSRSGTTATFA